MGELKSGKLHIDEKYGAIVWIGDGKTSIGGTTTKDGEYLLMFSILDEKCKVGEELGRRNGVPKNTFLTIATDNSKAMEVIREQAERSLNNGHPVEKDNSLRESYCRLVEECIHLKEQRDDMVRAWGLLIEHYNLTIEKGWSISPSMYGTIEGLNSAFKIEA